MSKVVVEYTHRDMNLVGVDRAGNNQDAEKKKRDKENKFPVTWGNRLSEDEEQPSRMTKSISRCLDDGHSVM